MSYWSYKPYQSVASRLKKAEAAIAKAKKSGKPMSPIAASRGAIAKSFWGKAWCDNLEHYSDYSNRLPRGSSYVRNGSVIDLCVTPGEVRAQVMGSALYKVVVTVKALPKKQWQAISTVCWGSIDSTVELLQGQLSNAVMENICKPGSGLFPAPKEIEFQCSCPDWAQMCKHVAAVLFGVGVRLDQQPELLFSLRKVDVQDLVNQAGASLSVPDARPARGKLLDDAMLGDVFGIEMADVIPNATSVPAPSIRRKASAATKATKATNATKATKTTNATKVVKATKGAKTTKATKVIKVTGNTTPAKPVVRRPASRASEPAVPTTPVKPAAKASRALKPNSSATVRAPKRKPASRQR